MKSAAMWLTLVLLTAAGCGGSDPKDPVIEGDDDDEVVDPNNGQTPPAPWDKVTFSVQDVELKTPAFQPALRGKLLRDEAGTLYYAYYRTGEPSPTCAIAISGQRSPSITYDVVVAVKPASATAFTLETVPLGLVPNQSAQNPSQDFAANPLGLDAALDNQGRLLITVPAGGGGLFLCASSDLVAIRRNGPGNYSVVSPVRDSDACCAEDATRKEFCSDPACVDGSDVGAWSAIAVRSDNSIAIAYTDTHNTTDYDGATQQGYELWQGADITGGGLVTGIRPWSGLGKWAQLREINGRLVTAFSAYGGKGAYVLTLQDDGSWTGVDQSFGATVGERLQLEVAPNGTVGLAYYAVLDTNDRKADDLYFCESNDNGVTFPSCSRPESATLVAGANPSLSYDAESRPVLSYYFCGSADCASDGLRVAWRDDDSKWWKFNIANIALNRAGQYSSIVLDPLTGEPTIVFQDITRGAAMVAYGKFN